MSKDQKFSPVTVKGITITEDVIIALDNLQDGGKEEIDFFTEQVMTIAAIDLYKYGLDRRLFEICLNVFNLMLALNQAKELSKTI